ncbi:MAG: glycosyltransferase, partial [Micrococcales bacterium]|nr:glycosyltransferase [Micrococcales bacterium]
PTVAIYQTDLVGFAQRYDVPGGVRAAAALTRRIHLQVDRTLAPSTASIAQLRDLDVPEVHRWARGVDTALFRPDRRDESLRASIAPGKRLVGYVGRLAAEKELDLLTSLAHDPRHALVLVGGGPEEQRLRSLLPGAHFLGLLHGEELAAAYASLDVFVHTGRHETFCQSAQEALASGVPVVAPRSGGPIDVVDDRVDGFLYAPGDRRALHNTVQRLVGDDEMRARMAAAGLAKVQGRTWRAVNDQLVGHYLDVIGTRQALRLAS